MDDDAARIASIMIGLADEGDEKSISEAKAELRAIADELDKVPTIVAKSNLAIALTLLHEEKDYYRYVGAEVLMRIWRRKSSSSPEQILRHQSFVCRYVVSFAFCCYSAFRMINNITIFIIIFLL
jgi:hypothetical protein